MKTKNTRRARIEKRPTTICIPTADGRGVAETLTVEVPMRWDPELDEWLMDSETMEYLEALKSRHMGLMLPAELLALRTRLGLTQRQMGELLRIGAKSWTRWETGTQRPSQSLNLLLKLLDTGLVTPMQLTHLGVGAPDWSRQFRQISTGAADDKPVALDDLRSSPTNTVAEPLAIPA